MLGTFTMCRAAYPHLSHASTPCVINISATLHYGATWWQVRMCGEDMELKCCTSQLGSIYAQAGILLQQPIFLPSQ